MRTARLLVALCVFGTAAAAASSTTAVRLRSGTVLETSGPVDRRDGLVVFRTAQGLLVSVREASVAEIVEPGGSPAAAAVPTATKLYTNADLPEGPAGYVPPPPGKIPASAETPVEPLTYDSYRDRDGHDEDWWRERAAGLDRNIRLAQERVERETARWHELDMYARVSCPLNRSGYFGGRCAAILGQAEEAWRRVEDAIAAERAASGARQALDAEAARAGALPGWLR